MRRIITTLGAALLLSTAACDTGGGAAAPDVAADTVALADTAGAAGSADTTATSGDTDDTADVPHEPYGFAPHLEEALTINRERRALYSALTDGASESLSDLMITVEEGLLPTARELDERGAPFQAEGIPIVADDFVPMADVLPYDTPAPRRGALSDAVEDGVAAALAPVRAADLGDLAAVTDAVRDALHELERLEEEHDVHLAMSKHLLESAGVAALHGLDYAARSDGRTYELSADLVRFQLELPLAMNLGLNVDKQANVFHRDGIGIIVNDVPPIPFLEEAEGR